MRRSSLSAWLFVAVAIGAIVASRFGRALGPTGIVLTIVLVVVAAVVLRNLVEAAMARSAGPERWRAPMKNVTPVEPALTSGAAPSSGSSSPEAPAVVVIDPPNGTERLAAKLQALDRLRADGLVSDDEYEAKRAQLIADF